MSTEWIAKLTAGPVLVAIWAYLLSVFHRAGTRAWKFIWGSCGLFLILMVYLREYIAPVLAHMVTAAVGIPGNLTGIYTAYFDFSSVYVETALGGVLLQIDIECSGVIEVFVFLSLLVFFQVYSARERFLYGVAGTAYLMGANAVRVLFICVGVHQFGYGSYNLMHSYLGRILFYGLSVLLYYYTFTRPQILSMRVGKFNYDTANRSEEERDKQ
jgi:exosortase family protein XrtG